MKVATEDFNVDEMYGDLFFVKDMDTFMWGGSNLDQLS